MIIRGCFHFMVSIKEEGYLGGVHPSAGQIYKQEEGRVKTLSERPCPKALG